MKEDTLYVCGSRAVVAKNGWYEIVCATCGNVKAKEANLIKAISYTTDTSDRQCSNCGNDARLITD